MIMVSPTGARLTKGDHPMVPLTIPEIVATTRACAASGADALHLHVRDAQGTHSLDVALYAEALEALDAALPGFPVQITTESAGRYTPAEQLDLLTRLAPKWASISVREVTADPTLAREVYATCARNGTRVQHIVYDARDAQKLTDLIANGTLPPAPEVILVLGSYAEQRPGQPQELPALVATLPEGARWMLCAFGHTEHTCLRAAARLGGDLRVGFENSITRADGAPWPSVEASVAAICAELEQAA